MGVRDQYFPASYTHATWLRLAPFFRLAGTIVPDTSTIHVELHPFNDRALNRDLAMLCERVNLAAPQLASWTLALLYHPSCTLHSCCANISSNVTP